MHRYPEATVTTDDIAVASLEALAGDIDTENDYASLWRALSKSAAKASNANDWPQAKALWLIADACSMLLRPDSTNEPFRAFSHSHSGRSAVVDDFTPEDVAFFSGVAEKTEHRLIRARLADIAWLCAKPRNRADALRAIDAYTAEEPTQDNIFHAILHWERAITICLQMRQGAADRLAHIEKTLIEIADVSIPAGDKIGLIVAKMIFKKRLAGNKEEHLADMLVQCAADLIAANNIHLAQSHLDLARQWYELLNNDDRAADITLEIGLSYEREADLLVDADRPNYIGANDCLGNAIQTLRQIARQYREARSVDAHLERLFSRLDETGKLALNSMVAFKSEPIDVTDIAREAAQSVSGKTFLEALRALANIHAGTRREKLEQEAKETLSDSLIGTLFTTAHYGPDGRVVAKTPAADSDQEGAQNYERALDATMVRHYQHQIQLISHAVILPALWKIIEEHHISKADLLFVMSRSPVIPSGRAEQFAKGIWEGFEQDFPTAIYLLAPQVEHMVRWHLKLAGIKTTFLDENGIRTENGLSALIKVPGAKEQFGEDLTFELEALFCTPAGPNLRNSIAHGLFSGLECSTLEVLYAWWLVLRITFNMFWAHTNKQKS